MCYSCAFVASIWFEDIDASPGVYPKAQTLRRLLKEGPKCSFNSAILGDSVCKTHDTLKAKDECVFVYLIRDPRDVVISQIHYVKSFMPGLSIWRDAQSPSEVYSILRARVLAKTPTCSDIRLAKTFARAWSDHVVKAYRGKSPYLIRYEDFKTDTREELERFIDHFGLRVPSGRIDECIEFFSFQALKDIEANEAKKRVSFFRKGVIGSWKEADPDLVDTIMRNSQPGRELVGCKC